MSNMATAVIVGTHLVKNNLLNGRSLNKDTYLKLSLKTVRYSAVHCFVYTVKRHGPIAALQDILISQLLYVGVKKSGKRLLTVKWDNQSIIGPDRNLADVDLQFHNSSP